MNNYLYRPSHKAFRKEHLYPALEKMPAAERELILSMVERIKPMLPKVGDISALELLAALGRLMIEEGVEVDELMRRNHRHESL